MHDTGGKLMVSTAHYVTVCKCALTNLPKCEV